MHRLQNPIRISGWLAYSSGLKACEQGFRTLFTTATGLLGTLGKACSQNRLERKLKVLAQPHPLIIDEIGYIPIDRQGANLFFQLVARRYEKGAIILTSNQSLGAWGEVFGNPVIGTARSGKGVGSLFDLPPAFSLLTGSVPRLPSVSRRPDRSPASPRISHDLSPVVSPLGGSPNLLFLC